MNRLLALATLPLIVACGADTFAGGDAGDGSDASPSADAADDHKIGVKLDGGSDATDPPDASDGGSTTSDASDGGTVTTGPRRVFMTLDEYLIGTGPAHFNSLASADAICQAHATKVALGGTWKAWLSSSTSSVSARFNHAGGPFKLVDDTVIANDWTELTSGTLQHKINEDESGNIYVSAAMWTATNANGTAGSATCADWTSNSNASNVLRGSSDYATSAWTATNTGTCPGSLAFLCFEQ